MAKKFEQYHIYRTLGIAIFLILLSGTVTAYQVSISAPSTVAQGSPLVVTGTTTFPLGASIDIVFSRVDTQPIEIATSTVTNHGDNTFGTLFDTNGLFPGQYRIEIPSGGYSWESGSTTSQLVQIVAQSDSTPTPTQTNTLISPTVTVTPTRTNEISVPTPMDTPTPRMGSITVISSPTEAIVELDNKNSQITPCTYTDLESGIYKISINKTGYIPWTTTVEVRAGTNTPITATLLPLKLNNGAINITSTPIGAMVFVNGIFLGPSPIFVSGLGSGSHEVKISHPGYNEWRGFVLVENGVTSELNQVLIVNTTSPPSSESSAILENSSPQEAVPSPISTSFKPTNSPVSTVAPTKASMGGILAVFGCGLLIFGLRFRIKRN